MKKVKFRQFAISLLTAFSLFVSSAAACVCNHHQETTEVESKSCHGHSSETHAKNQSGTTRAEKIQTHISESECCCVQPAPKASVKLQTVKIKKQFAAILPVLSENLIYAVLSDSENFDFLKPLYLSDSFYTLSPGRAPPRM